MATKNRRERTDKWRVTLSSRRNRKPITLTLPEMTRHKLTRLHEKTGESRSRIVERLIEEAKL